MQFRSEINRLLIWLLLVFGIIALAAVYWGIFGKDTIVLREDNPRIFERETRILRGEIYDRNGKLLVESILDENGRTIRNYLEPASFHPIGYASLRYGTGEIESAFDAQLRGELEETLTTIFERETLHQTQQGSDLQLTIDVDLQATLTDAMGDRNGAVVIVQVPDGAVLSMISQPSFDPNTLDEDWDDLIEADGDPFFNRVLQAEYQPGGVLQTPLIALAYLTDSALDVPISGGDQTIELPTTTIECVYQPPQPSLSLAEAYIYGCPSPFVEFGETVDQALITNMVASFREINTLHLDSLLPVVENEIEATPEIVAEDTNIDFILGQSIATLKPIEVVLSVAAIMNEGNAPSPYILHAIRQPNTEEWVVESPPFDFSAVFVDTAASQLQQLMIANIELGVINLSAPDTTIGGHSAIAKTGDTQIVWFTGFGISETRPNYAITVVLENEEDVSVATEIAQIAFTYLAEMAIEE